MSVCAGGAEPAEALATAARTGGAEADSGTEGCVAAGGRATRGAAAGGIVAWGGAAAGGDAGGPATRAVAPAGATRLAAAGLRSILVGTFWLSGRSTGRCGRIPRKSAAAASTLTPIDAMTNGSFA
jgi:hypothetical protein